jgi:hypothetical protein
MDRAGVPRQTTRQVTEHKTDAMYNHYRIVNEQDIRAGMAQAYLTAQKVDTTRTQTLFETTTFL